MYMYIRNNVLDNFFIFLANLNIFILLIMILKIHKSSKSNMMNPTFSSLTVSNHQHF